MKTTRIIVGIITGLALAAIVFFILARTGVITRQDMGINAAPASTPAR